MTDDRIEHVGYVLVPLEADDDMLKAGCSIPGVSLETGRRMWRAMLARTPSPSASLPLIDEAQTNPQAMVEALERLLAAITLRALRGRDHVPSMREEQDACSQAREALSLARKQIGERE